MQHKHRRRAAPALVCSTAADTSASDLSGEGGSATDLAEEGGSATDLAGEGGSDATDKPCNCSDTFDTEVAGREGTLAKFISSAARSRCNQPLNLELSEDGIFLHRTEQLQQERAGCCNKFDAPALRLQHFFDISVKLVHWKEIG